jgi:hypothetical protein
MDGLSRRAFCCPRDFWSRARKPGPMVWHAISILYRRIVPVLERTLGEVVRFIPKSDLERARLIREARAIYETIFPPAAPVGAERDSKQ